MSEPAILIPLSQARAGQRVRIHSLPLQPECRSRLAAMGIQISSELEVLRLGAPGGLLHLANGCLEFMLRRDVAHHMTVELVASASQ
jgi:Fe2+ transport system protein FeoA